MGPRLSGARSGRCTPRSSERRWSGTCGAADEQRPVTFETPSVWGRAWYEVHVYPSPDGVSSYFRDITERKRSEQQRRLLVDVSGVLAESLEYETTLARVVELVVSQFADWCAVDLVAPVLDLLGWHRAGPGHQPRSGSRDEGRVVSDSVLGERSAFTFTLPRGEGASEAR